MDDRALAALCSLVTLGLNGCLLLASRKKPLRMTGAGSSCQLSARPKPSRTVDARAKCACGDAGKLAVLTTEMARVGVPGDACGFGHGPACPKRRFGYFHARVRSPGAGREMKGIPKRPFECAAVQTDPLGDRADRHSYIGYVLE